MSGMTQERTPPTSIAADLLASSSVEVTPKTLAKEADLTSLLPAGKVVFIAHIAGTHIAEMVAAARRLRAKGFDPQPHIPARLLGSRAELADWLARYRGEAGVERALLLAGGLATPAGPFASSMDLLGTGLFDAAGFREIAFAGHPEGNRDIDPDGGTAHLDAALAWKQAFVARSDLKAALVTQFTFDPAPVLAWAGRIAAAGIDLPVRVGLAGPAKPATLLRYGLNCGVGASLRVLSRRAGDLGHMLRPFAPDDMLSALADHLAAHPESRISGIHLFPLGGLRACSDWAARALG
ncbi:methylenetetrahydrofolate reductase [Paenirhodobacter enshiensis]|uniref:Methylenetetrahydrofolate reductase n=2 Tax=Paenirhodobacter enshiensis TaxID=1105367 RepID=A0A086XZT3_9RHOB|nr:methylenetetrahydrofolate reductase [Paenirhodobacter enshiensis]